MKWCTTATGDRTVRLSLSGRWKSSWCIKNWNMRLRARIVWHQMKKFGLNAKTDF